MQWIIVTPKIDEEVGAQYRDGDYTTKVEVG
jgi:hypothetical protein